MTGLRRAVFLGLAAFSVSGPELPAGGVATESEHLGTVVELSSPATCSKYPALAFDGDGRLWAAWTSTRDGQDSILTRWHEKGRWSAPEQIDSGAGIPGGVQLARGAEGRLWAVWHTLRGDSWGVLARRHGKFGWEAEKRISPRESSAADASIAVVGDRVWVAYEVMKPGGFSVAVRFLEDEKLSSVLLLESAGSDQRPRLATCPSGTLHLAWDSTRSGSYDVFLARLGARGDDGPSVADVRPITSHPAIDDSPSLACAPDGDLWIAWHSNRARQEAALRTDRHDGDAFVRVLRQGQLLSPPAAAGALAGQISHGGVDKTPWATVADYWHWKQTQGYPRVFHDGRVPWVIWRSDATGAHNFDLFARSYDGRSWSPKINLTPFSAGRDEWPAAALAPDGRLHVAWEGQLLPTPERIEQYGRGDVDLYNTKGVPNVILTGVLPLRAVPPGIDGGAGLSPAPTEEVGDPALLEPPLSGPPRGSESTGDGTWTLFFGDPHSHSILSDAKVGLPDQILSLSRDFLEIDFAVVSDHAEMGLLQPSEWAKLQRVSKAFNQPGRFVSLSGWEWTAGTHAGHRVVVFEGDGVAPLSADRAEGNSIEELYDHIRGHRGVLSPHHTGHAAWGRWNPDAFHDEELEPNFEIASWHGRFEFYGNPWEGRRQVPGHQYQDALRRGRHVGVMAASDTHHLTPGEGGLTVVLAESLDRKSIFAALRERRNYATTGARIVLEFTVAGAPMGSIIQGEGTLEMAVRVVGTAAIDRVEIVRNLIDSFAAVRLQQNPKGPDGVFVLYHPRQPQVVEKMELADTRRLSFTVTDEDGKTGETSYYVRVTQADGHQAWSSPIWVRR